MRWSTHIAAGLFLGVALFETHPIQIALTAVGSVIPDIDVPSSFVSKKTHSAKNRTRLLKHRGILHSITMPLIIYLVYWEIFKNNGIVPFLYGYILHLFLDAFTPAGIKLFQPFSNAKIRLGNIKTGSIYDRALGIIFLLLSFFAILIPFLSKTFK